MQAISPIRLDSLDPRPPSSLARSLVFFLSLSLSPSTSFSLVRLPCTCLSHSLPKPASHRKQQPHRRRSQQRQRRRGDVTSPSDWPLVVSSRQSPRGNRAGPQGNRASSSLTGDRTDERPLARPAAGEGASERASTPAGLPAASQRSGAVPNAVAHLTFLCFRCCFLAAGGDGRLSRARRWHRRRPSTLFNLVLLSPLQFRCVVGRSVGRSAKSFPHGPLPR